MWRDFGLSPAIPGAPDYRFVFPDAAVPSWTETWSRIVSHVRIAPDADSRTVLLDSFAHSHGVRTLGFVNAHALNSCVRDVGFATDLISLDVLVRDGIGVQALYRLTGEHAGINLNGTDLLPELMARFAGKRIALFGTRLPLVEQVARQLEDELGCTTLVADGFRHDGYYLERVMRERPDLVVLGMGMPKQERIARLMRDGLDQDVAVACGGAILDFLAGHVSRAPLWMRRTGLEWAYRLSLEPKRLFGRYVIGNPLFLLRSALLRLRGGPLERRHDRFSTVPPAPRPALALDRPPRPELRLVTAPASPAASAPPAPAASSFSANRPVVVRDDLFGRQRDLDRLTKWVLDQRGSALVYGPRGYGKTSLVRVFGEIADSLGHVVLYTSASRHTDFTALMRTFLGEIPAPGIELPAGPLTVQQVAGLLAGHAGQSLVFILDEFDRVEDETTRAALVELIKDSSDLNAGVRFLLVGVARDAHSILGYHPSVHRCLSTIPLSRLDATASEDLLRHKARVDGLRLDDEVVATAMRLAGGSAYHLQLIGQKLVGGAQLTGDARVTPTALDVALDEIVGDAVRIDPPLAALAREFAIDPRRRAALLAVARAALDDPEDSVLALTGKLAATDRDAACAWLAAQGALVPGETLASGATVRYRFADAFTPQLLLMMDHLLAVRHRAPR